ncbi:unnamed protein product [Toxocara canis]|uniref:DUF4817 domain-containing protein n=1 Tax=Toxocara canis TaxID=6265 RepID=A0A183V9V6_TOXCA|nr:unnamed protein product [Toxocara canis]
MIQRSIPSRAKEEEELHEEMTKSEENFLEVWLQGQEKIGELQENLDEIDQQLRNHSKTPSDSTQKEALLSEDDPYTLRFDTTDTATDAQECDTTNSPTTSRLLPTQQLPIYTDDPLRFNEFWDFFRDAVHRQNISPIQKYHYLLGCLKGRAHAATEGRSITSANYSEAVDIIKRRFGNPSTMKLSLYNQLRKVPACTMRTKDLSTILEAVEKCCRQLRALEEEIK